MMAVVGSRKYAFMWKKCCDVYIRGIYVADNQLEGVSTMVQQTGAEVAAGAPRYLRFTSNRAIHSPDESSYS